MPEDRTLARAKADARQGKSPSTQAGEFVREEIEHVREGKHGARSTSQAIAIGLSKARRAGVKLPPRKNGATSARSAAKERRDYTLGQTEMENSPSPTRSRATTRALERESHQSASTAALSRHARESAQRRGPTSRQQAAAKAVHTKGKAGLQRATKKAAVTRAARNK